ncbi:hypothetical protein CLNEO_06310 [Anaerotignum neopropionicum]|uniref:Uncharacterized protein n=1 Tax=Anaerotignum neopropionicum TaxID=36847 RepID=A0A136WJ83_9FIRM|nr:hypothetical protein [Anaerotignum neopropionicum]KXL54524.1 hypothetical protein CLNEO_06310 [Anaerotignum neopropionicum]
MLEERLKKDERCKVLIEYSKTYFLDRAYQLENRFYSDYYVQCTQSTAADAYENFLETAMEHNYFKNKLQRLDETAMLRFFKLAAIHHTIRMVRRRKKSLSWEDMKDNLFQVYDLTKNEKEMADILQRCAFLYQSGFQDLFIKTTARYIFGDKELSAFSFAFIGNFWYNSYSSFMGSFTGYVPFHVRMERAMGE